MTASPQIVLQFFISVTASTWLSENHGVSIRKCFDIIHASNKMSVLVRGDYVSDDA